MATAPRAGQSLSSYRSEQAAQGVSAADATNAYNTAKAGDPTSNIQGSTVSVQPQSSVSVQPTVSTSTLQGSSPYLQGSTGATTSLGATPTGGDATGGTAPAYDPVAAAAAADLAEAKALRGTFGSLFKSINSIYDTIYGRLTRVGEEKAGQVVDRYDDETTALGTQFTQELPMIGNAYAARGAADSSYRYDADQRATSQYNNVVDDLTLQRNDDLASVGQYVTDQHAGITADKAKIEIIKTRIAESEDPAELRQLKTEYQNLKADLEARSTGTQSQESLTNTANQMVDTRDRTASLQAGLTSIITGAAPNALKTQVAQGMIAQSGLSAEDQQRMIDWFGSQLVPDEQPIQEPVAPTVG